LKKEENSKDKLDLPQPSKVVDKSMKKTVKFAPQIIEDFEIDADLPVLGVA